MDKEGQQSKYQFHDWNKHKAWKKNLQLQFDYFSLCQFYFYNTL